MFDRIKSDYEIWLREYRDDPSLTSELEAIAGDEAEISDRFYRELAFGTGGIRGVLGAGPNRMNIYVVRRVSRALAQLLSEAPSGRERGVVIAYDSRRRSADFALEAALVLAASGVRVRLFESLRPVPELSFSVRHLGCAAGVEITASHNPPQYNGYKIYGEDGGQLPPDAAARIAEFFPSISYGDARPIPREEALAKGLLSYVGAEVDDAYMVKILTLLTDPQGTREMGKELKIVYTPLHGTGNLPVRRMLREIGMENVYVVPEQELPDGNFPTVRVPNPEETDAMEMACRLMKEKGADLCFATDPDCDRVGVACAASDGSARLLNGNQLGCVLLDYLLSTRLRLGTLPSDAAAVSTIVSTSMGRRICEKYGVDFIQVLTGFKFIAEQIQLFEERGGHTFVFGFEESCGYLSGTFVRDKDGVNACLLIAEAAAYHRRHGRTLLDALEALNREFGCYDNRLSSFVMPGADGLEKMRSIMGRIRANPPSELGGMRVNAVRDYLSGLRRTLRGEETELDLPQSDVLYFELENDCWVCLRPSGTEPKLKVYSNMRAEAEEEARALSDRVQAEVRALLLES